MKKSKIIFIFIIIAIVFCILGFILGRIIPKKESIVGTYYCDDWNGSSATLVVNENGTCKYPTGDIGKWEKNNKNINIFLQKNSIIANDSSVIETKEDEYNDKHIAIIVDNGLILHDKLFRKVN